MTTMTHVEDALGPDDLRLASEAFEAALFSLDEGTTAIHPYTARQVLARYIIHQALRGQRDLHRLWPCSPHCRLRRDGGYSHGYATDLKLALLTKWADHIEHLVQLEGAALLR